MMELDVVTLLNKLEINFRPTKGGRELTFICPFHNDSAPSCSMNPEKKMFNCFGCGTSGSAIDFLMLLKNINFKEAIGWLKENCGYEHDGNIIKELDKMDTKKFIEDFKSSFEFKKKDINAICESNVAKFAHSSLRFVLGRGLTQETLDEFEVGYSTSGKFVDRFTFPIRDENGVLVGFSGRTSITTWKEQKIPKWYHSYSVPTSMVLYNFQRAKIEIPTTRDRSIIITEGPIDVLKAYQSGYKNIVALMGLSLSEFHEHLLLKNVFKVFLALDGDERGREASRKLKYRLSKFFKVVDIEIPNGNDLGGLSESGIKNLLDKYRIRS